MSEDDNYIVITKPLTIAMGPEGCRCFKHSL